MGRGNGGTGHRDDGGVEFPETSYSIIICGLRKTLNFSYIELHRRSYKTQVSGIPTEKWEKVIGYANLPLNMWNI